MDTKKTNLTPELKEIYDRVMNTSNTSQVTPKATAEPLQPSVAPIGAPNAPSPTVPQPVAATPQPSVSAQPAATAPVMPPPTASPSMPPMPGTAEDALSNTPPRPIAEGNTFSFSGSAPSSSIMNAPQAAAAKAPKGKFKLSIPVLIAIGIVFIVVWGVFWAIIFGFIKR